MAKLSPFAPETFPALADIDGVRLATGNCGLRYAGRDDLLLVELERGTTVAGVVTQSRTAAAPVVWTRASLPKGRARALVANAGNANAYTGKAGARVVARTAAAAAETLGCPRSQVYVASTGVIGEPLDAEKIAGALPRLAGGLGVGAWERAARAISTTDTFPKGASARAEIGGTPVAISGIAKGSGMIAPNMATMLAFVFTDAALPAPVLHRLLVEAVDASFNSITVDGDTSTSDMALLFATGRANNAPGLGARSAGLASFRAALGEVCGDLARQIVRDGEGAEKFVTITVTGAASARAARRIGLAIANSPLVKTAIAGSDANWGRVVMAVGKSGERIDPDRLQVSMGGITLTRDGGRVPDYDEAPVARHLAGREVDIAVDVGVGRGTARVWTCDLTHGYIDINADYRS